VEVTETPDRPSAGWGDPIGPVFGCRLHLTTDADKAGILGIARLATSLQIEALGGFDEALPCAFNDVDLCLRIRRAGRRILWTPQAERGGAGF